MDDLPLTRQCQKCNEEKIILTHFYIRKTKQGTDRPRNICKQCECEITRINYFRRKEARKLALILNNQAPVVLEAHAPLVLEAHAPLVLEAPVGAPLDLENQTQLLTSLPLTTTELLTAPLKARHVMPLTSLLEPMQYDELITILDMPWACEGQR